MIIIKTEKEISIIREGGHHLARVMDLLISKVKPGVTTEELEEIALKEFKKIGGKPAFKGYEPSFGHEPFPTALCTSINEGIVHCPATPAKTLKEGDIIGIDIGLEFKGMFTDMARTVPVGRISKEAHNLLKATQESLESAINSLRVGESLYNVGEAVDAVAKKYNCSIIRDLVGHGVGKEIHEDPQVPNFKDSSMKKVKLKPGMVLAIEPMLSLGSSDIKLDKDKWTYITADRSLAAQFENTIAVHEDGEIEILTPTKWRYS